jgi:hypothetical protein
MLIAIVRAARRVNSPIVSSSVLIPSDKAESSANTGGQGEAQLFYDADEPPRLLKYNVFVNLDQPAPSMKTEQHPGVCQTHE